MAPRKKRPPLLPQILCGLLFCFTVFVFAPIDMTVLNRSDLWFGLGDFVPFFLLLFAVSFLFLELVWLLLRRLPYPLYMMLLALFFGLTVAWYVQGNFLCLSNSVLVGDAPQWNTMGKEVLGNLAIWAVILLAAMGLMLVRPKLFLKVVSFACGLILVMEGAALTVSVVDYYNQEGGSQDYPYYSVKDQFTFSQNGDVLVFMLDRLDSSLIDRVLSENPEYLKTLDGFTYYRNTSSSYHQTYPSFVSMLTGELCRNEEPFFTYTDRAFRESAFFPTLLENDFTIDIYGAPGPKFYFVGETAAQVDNLLTTKSVLNNMPKFVYVMLRMEAYRYAPTVFQPFMMMEFDYYFNSFQSFVEGSVEAASDVESVTARNYRESGVTIDNDRRFFKFYATQGAHPPYHMNRTGEWLSGETSQYEHLLGSLTLVGEWLEGIRAAGAYDPSTIIILGDHGNPGIHSPAMLVKYPDETGSEIQVSDAPVCLLDLRATALCGAGIDCAEFGTPAHMWEGETERERIFYLYDWTDARGLTYYLGDLTEYRVPADAADSENYRPTGNVYRPGNQEK